MSSEKTDLAPGLVVKVNSNLGLYNQGQKSCQSCYAVNYNGETCGEMMSPRYGTKVTSMTYCRFWSPLMGRNAPLKQ